MTVKNVQTNLLLNNHDLLHENQVHHNKNLVVLKKERKVVLNREVEGGLLVTENDLGVDVLPLNDLPLVVQAFGIIVLATWEEVLGYY